MIDVLKEIILDFQRTKIASSTPRELEIKTMRAKATVCIGVRRCGKSTLMEQLALKLLKKGVLKENIVFINLFDDRLHQLKSEGLGLITEAYYAIYPEKKNTECVYFFFDEIQIFPDWESFIDRLLRTENCQVHITGSSAQMLSREIATQMRGRALSWELFPFSFSEFLRFHNIETKKNLSTKERLIIQKYYQKYWESGGFPEVADLDQPLRIKVHQEYFNALLFRDLIERHDIGSPKVVVDLAHRLINNISALYSINKLTNYVRSVGHKTTKSKVSDYLDWFEDAYFLFTVPIFDASISRTKANPKKIYCIDHAFVTSIGSGILVNRGHLLENLVFVALRRRIENIYYYRSPAGHEVDFLVQKQNQSITLVQVCYSMVAEETRKREVRALSEAMTELNLDHGIIVTQNESETIQLTAGVIEVVPAWRFLLTVSALT